MGRPFGMARYNNILRAMLTVRISLQLFTAGRPLGRPLQLRLVAAYFFIACMRFRSPAATPVNLQSQQL